MNIAILIVIAILFIMFLLEGKKDNDKIEEDIKPKVVKKGNTYEREIKMYKKTFNYVTLFFAIFIIYQIAVGNISSFMNVGRFLWMNFRYSTMFFIIVFIAVNTKKK